MIRFNHYLSEPLARGLEILERRTGLSRAELVRRAIESHLKREGISLWVASKEGAGAKEESGNG